MKFLVLTAFIFSAFALPSESLAGGWFSVQLKGRDVSSQLIIPVQDRALARLAVYRISKVNVNLSNRTHLVIQFQLPNTVATAQNLLVYEGDIRNNVARMTGPTGTLLCRIEQVDVTCRLELAARQTDLARLERHLRTLKWPEVLVKNRLDIASEFNTRRIAYLRFSREEAGLRFSR